MHRIPLLFHERPEVAETDLKLTGNARPVDVLAVKAQSASGRSRMQLGERSNVIATDM